MMSTGTAFWASAPTARDPTVTVSEKPMLSAMSRLIGPGMRSTSMIFAGRPSPSTLICAFPPGASDREISNV